MRVSRLEQPRLPESLSAAVEARYAQGETVVLVERGDDVIGAIAVTTPLRPEAGPASRRLHEMGMRTAILSGDSGPAVVTVGAELGIDEVQADLSPAGKVGGACVPSAARRARVLMVGDGVNDAPALAAAAIGCAIGSGSEAALANSDVALLGNDLNGVPAAVNLARATYAVMLQNFGWAMGYNIAALPLAAAGLIDPLVAAVAMGLSSLLVVANSLRLARLGRSGLADVPRLRRLRGGVGHRAVGSAASGAFRRADRGRADRLARQGPVPAAGASVDLDYQPASGRERPGLPQSRRARTQRAARVHLSAAAARGDRRCRRH